eukprot:1910543-Prymnesium_polylepis.1
MAPTSDFSLAESFAEIWIQQAISAHVSQLASDLPPFAPPLAPPPPTVEDGGSAGRGDEETALTDLVSSVFCNCVHAALLRAEGEGLFSSPAAAPDCPWQSVAAEPDALSHSALSLFAGIGSLVGDGGRFRPAQVISLSEQVDTAAAKNLSAVGTESHSL